MSKYVSRYLIQLSLAYFCLVFTMTTAAQPAPVVTGSVTPPVVDAFTGTATMAWGATDATSCTANGQTFADSGSFTAGPWAPGDHSQYFTCTGPGGTTGQTVYWTAVDPNAQPPVQPPLPPPVSNACSTASIAPFNAYNLGHGNYQYLVTGTTGSGGWGTGTYTDDSPIAMMAVHAGIVGSGQQAVIQVNKGGGQGSFTGSVQNGVNTNGYGYWGGSYTLSLVEDCSTPSGPSLPEITTSTSPSAVISNIDAVTMNWTATGADSCQVFGSTYGTTDSRVEGPFQSGNYDRLLSCTGPGGTTTTTISWTVSDASTTPPPPPPPASCSSHPIAPGSAASLSHGTYTYRVTGSYGSGYGTGIYSDDSNIAAMAVHAGIVSIGEEAVITLTRMGGQNSFQSSTQNGISTSYWDYWGGSYSLALQSDCTSAATEAPTLNSFTLSRTSIMETESLSVSWDSSANAETCTINQNSSLSWQASAGGATIPALSFYPDVIDLTLICSNDNGNSSSITHALEVMGPDPTPQNFTDLDGDGMSDAWEVNNGLDPSDASDGDLDSDSDTFSNLEEFLAYSDPEDERSTPNRTVEISAGFTSDYIVGLVDVDQDGLTDLFIRRDQQIALPFESGYRPYVPVVSDFWLRQLPDQSFTIESMDGLVGAFVVGPISSAVRLGDFNGDGLTDLALQDLDLDIPGAYDQIIYAPQQGYVIPDTRVAVTPELEQFFTDLAGVINDPNYFNQNVQYNWLPLIISVTLIETSAGPPVFRSTPLPQAEMPFGCNVGYVLCINVEGDENDSVNSETSVDESGAGNSSGSLYIGYGNLPKSAGGLDSFDDPTETNGYFLVRVEFSDNLLVPIPDYSGYSRDAVLLNNIAISNIESEGDLYPGSNEAVQINDVLEAYLNSIILGGGLLEDGAILSLSEYPEEETTVFARIMQVIEYARDALTGGDTDSLPAPPVPENIPDTPIDIYEITQNCRVREIGCDEDDFSVDEENELQRIIDELSVDLINSDYSSHSDAAVALHNSELNELAQSLGIEFWASIDFSSVPVKIVRTSTGFRNRNTGPIRPEWTLGNRYIWHNHPRNSRIGTGDAYSAFFSDREAVCQGGDQLIYASGATLTRTGARSILDKDRNGFEFEYEEYVNGVWEPRSVLLRTSNVSTCNN